MIESDDRLGRRRVALGLACVLLAVLGVWLRSLYGEFVYDDNLLIRRNPALSELSNWPSVVGRGMWSFLDAHDARHLGLGAIDEAVREQAIDHHAPVAIQRPLREEDEWQGHQEPHVRRRVEQPRLGDVRRQPGQESEEEEGDPGDTDERDGHPVDVARLAADDPEGPHEPERGTASSRPEGADLCGGHGL